MEDKSSRKMESMEELLNSGPFSPERLAAEATAPSSLLDPERLAAATTPSGPSTAIDPRTAMRIPPRYRKARLEQLEGINDKVEKIKKAFVDEDKSIVLTGPCGTGKTHVACCMIYSWAAKHRPTDPKGFPRFVSMQDLADQIKRSWSATSSRTEEAIMGEFMRAPVLLLDDVGVGNVSDWSRGLLYSIIDKRYRHDQPVIITTNMTIEEIGTKIDDRIASRLCEMGLVAKLGDKDWRIK